MLIHIPSYVIKSCIKLHVSYYVPSKRVATWANENQVNEHIAPCQLMSTEALNQNISHPAKTVEIKKEETPLVGNLLNNSTKYKYLNSRSQTQTTLGLRPGLQS